MATSHVRGKQSDDWLKLSHDRKVSPQGWLQKAHGKYQDRWVPSIPNSIGLPSGLSCPGMTQFCESCYASNTENYSPGVRALVMHNYNLLVDADLDRMVALIDEAVCRFLTVCKLKGVAERDRIFRLHWDGDFFSELYALAWATVMKRHPQTAFWAYTRSFVAPVNVVPVLAMVPNLALYLSADQFNIEEARGVVAQFSSVLIAFCTEDYATGRDLAQDRKVSVCPENSGKMPLVSDKGRGACVDCRWCPDAKRDVIFSTSHLENIQQPLPLMGVSAGTCNRPGCEERLFKKPGPGRKPLYCSPQCRWKMYRSSVKAAQ